MSDHADLLHAWTRLCERQRLADAAPLGRDLLSRYGEPHRAFHTAAHLRDVTAVLGDIADDDRLLLAAWFHDAVYEPGRADNEARSAALAHAALQQRAYGAAATDFVCTAVMATASHVTDRPEFEPLLDADLSVLGAAPPAYAAYCAAIRTEYAALPAADFQRGRIAFVSAVLARPSIFQTAPGRARFEPAARANLQAELRELAAAQCG